MADQTTEQQTTQASEAQAKAWNAMDLSKQQQFVTKNTGFDPTKYGLTFKSATPAPVNTQDKLTQWLVDKYATVEDMQSDTKFKSLAPELQQKALNLYKTKWTQQPQEQQQQQQQPTTETDINKIDTPERLTQVKTNLDQYANTNQNLFKNRDAYDDFFQYTDRSDKQKAVLDDFWLDKGKKVMYNQMSTSQLADGVANGDFSETDLDYLKTDDPLKYQQYETAKTLANQKIQNNLLVSSMNSLLGDKDKNGVPDYIDTLNKKADEAFQSYQEYQDEKTTPEMTDLQANMATLNEEIKTAQLDQISLKKKIMEENKGVPASIVNAIVADQTADLQDSIARKTITYNTMLGTYNSKLQTIKDDYDLETQRITAETSKWTNQLTSLQTLMNIGATQANIMTKAEDPNIGKTINVWTTKSPQYMQWNTETQTYDIPVSGAGVTVWWTWWGWAGWVSKMISGDASDLVNRLNNIITSYNSSPVLAAWQIASWLWNIWADWNYIKSNLLFKKYVDAKASWVTFGATSEGEWKKLQDAVSALNWSVSPEYAVGESNKLITKLWWKPTQVYAPWVVPVPPAIAEIQKRRQWTPQQQQQQWTWQTVPQIIVKKSKWLLQTIADFLW